MSNPFQKIKIVKLFASSEYKTRNKAHKVITKLLKFEFGNDTRQLNEKDIIGIWKGLYMWLWMQDKPILHEEVVGKICKLLSEISSDKVAMEFINAFFITMMREWKKIDVHRLDKFYMLSRDFFSTCLLWLQSKDINEWFLSMIGTNVLNGKADQGIEFKLHLIDILLDELTKTQCSSEMTTGLLITCIKSTILLSQKHVYLQRMKKRVIERTFQLNVESKIELNMNVIGNAIREMLTTENIFPKTRKMLRKLSDQFLRFKKSENVIEVTVTSLESDEAIKVNDDVTMEEKEIVNIENGELEKTATDEIKADDNMVASDTESEEETSSEEETETTILNPANVPLNLPTKVMKKAVVVAGKRTAKKKPNVLGVAKDRKVTFGKKYTKKFKKSDVNVSTSLGTIKNTQMKSILKKR